MPGAAAQTIEMTCFENSSKCGDVLGTWFPSSYVFATLILHMFKSNFLGEWLTPKVGGAMCFRSELSTALICQVVFRILINR